MLSPQTEQLCLASSPEVHLHRLWALATPMFARGHLTVSIRNIGHGRGLGSPMGHGFGGVRLGWVGRNSKP